jgi:chemotaxis protein MotB
MSFRGEKYDGDFFGGSVDSSERRDSFDNESKTGRNASAKRTIKQNELLDSEENPFTESGDKDRYLITYSDLITLLLGLFIILYAVSNIDNGKYKNVVAAMGSYFGNESIVPKMSESKVLTSPKEKISEELNKLIVENNYSNSIQLEETERGVTIHILDDILFPPGKADINESSKLVLKKIAKVLSTIPNDIRIEGHTDNMPIYTERYPSNWHLSVDRALTTAYYLIKQENISPDKVSIVGFSEYRPIASNSTPESRAKNRRVDLVILK